MNLSEYDICLAKKWIYNIHEAGTHLSSHIGEFDALTVLYGFLSKIVNCESPCIIKTHLKVNMGHIGIHYVKGILYQVTSDMLGVFFFDGSDCKYKRGVMYFDNLINNEVISITDLDSYRRMRNDEVNKILELNDQLNSMMSRCTVHSLESLKPTVV